MLSNLIKLLVCHFIGDYFLQNDFIAKTKGDNVYHLLVHCILYLVPFYFVSCNAWQLTVLFMSHIVIDALKATWHKISYTQDQLLHFGVICLIWFSML